jgi:hypothetical protein
MIALAFRRKFRSRVGMRRSPISAVPGNDAREAQNGRVRERQRGHDKRGGGHGDLTPNATWYTLE